MLLQSYDFLHLYQNYDCVLELGGNDQWSNMLGGVDLVRRVEGKEVYAMTSSLLLTKEGKKMGKTEKGALQKSVRFTTYISIGEMFRMMMSSTA